MDEIDALLWTVIIVVGIAALAAWAREVLRSRRERRFLRRIEEEARIRRTRVSLVHDNRIRMEAERRMASRRDDPDHAWFVGHHAVREAAPARPQILDDVPLFQPVYIPWPEGHPDRPDRGGTFAGAGDGGSWDDGGSSSSSSSSGSDGGSSSGGGE